MANTNIFCLQKLVQPSPNDFCFSKSNDLNFLKTIEEKKKACLNNFFIKSKLNYNKNQKINPINIPNNLINDYDKKNNNTNIGNSFETGFNIVNNKFESLKKCNYDTLVSSFDSNFSFTSDDQEDDIFECQI